MDVGAEISKKIQMAITAKLKELNAYVDDELPDYIMIMVANKKTEDQMTDALSLFLSGNTKIFTAWLHNLLATLRKAKVEKASEENSVPERESGHSKERQKSQDPKLEKSDSAINPPKEEQTRQSSKQLQENNTEAVIAINHETEDILDEELLLHQTDTSLLLETAIDGDIGNVSKDEEIKNVRSQNDKNLKTPFDKEKVEKESKKRESSRQRKESDSTSSYKSNDRKRRSDEQNRRRSRHSRSPKSRRESTRSRQDNESRKSKPETKRTQGLESDSSRFSRASSKAVVSRQEPTMREWDRGKGEDIEKEIVTNWERRQNKHQKYNSKQEKKEELWMSSDDEEAGVKGKSSVSSAVKPVHREPEFVSESDSDGDTAAKPSGITSKIAYPQRRIRVPLNKQANRALLMKAMSDAEKSVRRDSVTMAMEEEEETPLIHSKPPPKAKRSIKSRLTLKKQDEEWIEKPAKVRRRSTEKGEGRKKVTERLLTRPMYQDLAPEDRDANKYEEIISVDKTVKTVNRTMSSSKQNSESSVVKGQTQRKKKSEVKKTSAKVLLLKDKDGDKEEPDTVIHVRQKPQSGKGGEVIYVDNGSSSSEESFPVHFKRDKRNFIHREKEPSDNETETNEDGNDTKTSVKFDSRRTTSNSLGYTESERERATARVSPQPKEPQSPESIPKIEKPRPISPQFIVTLDGVAAPTKTNSDQIGKTKFKFKPVTAPDTESTSDLPNNTHAPPTEAPTSKAPENDPDDNTGEISDLELKKMREKLIKVQEEATKLKRMQAKLAAAHEMNQAPVATNPPRRMHADKIETEQKSIYIGNVHFAVTEKQLSEYFSICGKVERATVLKDAYTGHPKGSAYIQFEDKLAVSSALALDNTTFNGRVIRVTLKQSKPVLPVAYPVPRGRFVLRRAYAPRARGKYFAPAFRPRFRLATPRPTAPLTRNKTWVNPAIK